MLEAKFWPADGAVAEPADWQLSWARPEHSGFAGLTGGSGGLSEFEVDYVLIKANGLKNIKVTPLAFTLVGPPATQLKFTSITKTTGNVVLEWTGTGVLEQSDQVGGPWTPVTPAAVSPLTVPASGSAKFYRLH